MNEIPARGVAVSSLSDTHADAPELLTVSTSDNPKKEKRYAISITDLRE